MEYDGDEFDDEDFADLLGEDLYELEKKALQSTQAVPGTTNHWRTTSHGQSHLPEPSGIDDTGDFENDGDEVIDGAQASYAQLPSIVAQPLGNGRRPDHSRNSVTRPQAVAGYVSKAEKGPAVHHRLPFRTGSQTNDETPQELDSPLIRHIEEYGSNNIDELQAQVKDLLRDREKLQLAVQEANRQVFSKSGEIAIVRANNERATREKEQKIVDLERQLKAAKDQRDVELEEARKQQEQLATESRFADHDRVVVKARSRKQAPRQEEDVVVASKSRSRLPNVYSTPKKNRQTVLGDGFNVQERSPAPSSTHSREATPSAAEKKRKRRVESPSRRDAWYSENDDNQVSMFNDDTDNARVDHLPSGAASGSTDKRYLVLQRFLDHRREWRGPRTIEALASFKFPSDDQTLLSTCFYDGISQISPDKSDQDFKIGLCSTIIALWTKCLSEKYYDPLAYLIDAVQNFLGNYPDLFFALMDELVSLAQTTSDVNVVPRFKHFRKTSSSKTSDPLSAMSQDVSVAANLDLLLAIVQSIDARDVTSAGRFWRLIRFDFLSMLLRPSQDPEHVSLMAQLLGYSVNVGSIGSIIEPKSIGSSQEQSGFTHAKSEEHILDRLSSMLIELPKPIFDGQSSYSARSICEMRLAILQCFSSFATKQQTSRKIVDHPLVIGRLVRCMADGFHFALESSPNSGSSLESHLAVVSEATRLVYHYTNAYSNVDINAKLLKIPGGPQKYLVVLSRLVFSEGTLYGVEIEEDVLDCAQALLEDFVSPDEAEMLMEMASDDV